jgi:hypothetical protein
MVNRFSIALAAASCLLSVPAYAGVNVTTADGTSSLAVGDSSDVTFNGIGGNPVITIPGLASDLLLTYLGMTTVAGNTVFNFTYALSNSSTLTGARVSSFGFNVTPNVGGASATGDFDTASLNTNYPVGFGTVNVCFYDGPGGTCTGNGNGVVIGDAANGTLALTMNGLINDIALSDFVDRYQGFNYQGIQSAIGTSITSGVPEPATWAMMILGIGLAGAAMRRKRSALALATA